MLLICLFFDCAQRLLFAEIKCKEHEETGGEAKVIANLTMIGITRPTFELVEAKIECQSLLGEPSCDEELFCYVDIILI